MTTKKDARLLLFCVVLGAAPASAQEMVQGMQIVPIRQGWARYRREGPEGSSTVVIRVGATERRAGRAATWIGVETDVPEAGRLRIESLVAGTTLDPKNLLAIRVSVPGQEPREKAVTPRADGPAVVANVVGKKQARISGKPIEVTTFEVNGLVVDWSAAVPGFGFVRVGGSSPMALEDFGVGGDAWHSLAAPSPPPKKP